VKLRRPGLAAMSKPNGSNGTDPIAAALAAAGADPASAVLTIPEAAAVLRVGRTAAYAAVRTGELRVCKIGRSLRVPRQALAAMLETDAP
jgi:excisionase family DNA binding protein